MREIGTWSTIRLAVIGLILYGIVAVTAVTFLLWSGNQAPDGLIAIAATSVGALATLLMHQAPTSPAPPPEQ